MDTKLYTSNEEFTEDLMLVSNFVITLPNGNFYIMILIVVRLGWISVLYK